MVIPITDEDNLILDVLIRKLAPLKGSIIEFINRYHRNGIYRGEKNEMVQAHGRGFFIWGKSFDDDIDIYESYQENGQHCDQGKFKSVDGTFYEGEQKNDKAHCFGIFECGKKTNLNGEKYEGHQAYGEYNGKGKKIYANGDIYEGKWKNNLRIW